MLPVVKIFMVRHSDTRMRLRFTVGMAQMAGATIAIVLLFGTGVTPWALTATVITCVLTTISVLLFGGKR